MEVADGDDPLRLGCLRRRGRLPKHQRRDHQRHNPDQAMRQLSPRAKASQLCHRGAIEAMPAPAFLNNRSALGAMSCFA